MYRNEENDIIIIELKENEFDLKDYLKLDDDIYKVKEYNDKVINKINLYYSLSKRKRTKIFN